MTNTRFNFAIGFSDAQIEVAPEHYTPAWPQMAALQPAFWRLVIDWGLTAPQRVPGPFQGVSSNPVTATAYGSGFVGNAHTSGSAPVRATASGTGQVVGVAPSAQNRNWNYPDNVLNDMRLKTNGTMDIIMVIGQAAPYGWTNADYKAFCAECVVRYGPGGQGIRTDGPYAAINTGWGVRFWEIWNEQNNSVYWTQTVNPQQYTSFLQAGYQGIKSVAPSTPAPGVNPTGNQSVVIFGGMQHIPFSGVQFGYGYFGFDEVTFLQKCFESAIKDLGTTLGTMYDVMATHVYPYGDFIYSSGTGATSGFPSNLISSMNFPAINTSANQSIQARAYGSGAINITPTQAGRLNTLALAQGNGVLNNFEPPGVAPNLPSMFMDNMRQLQGIYALMVAHGDGAKKIAITECGYGVYETNSSPDFQNKAVQALFALFQNLPYIWIALLYNAIDANNSKTADGFTGFGTLDYDRNPRPLYNWLLSLPSLAGGGTQTFQATATGSGSISSGAAATVNVVTSTTGRLTYGGGIIFANVQGAGLAQNVANGARIIAATAIGVGVVGLYTGGGTLNNGGGLNTTAVASGLGKTALQPHSNGDRLVQAAATGFGTVGQSRSGITQVVATIRGDSYVAANGAEIGVVGEVTGGALSITATPLGAGQLVSGDSGFPVFTAAALGAGTVGKVTGGALTESYTALASGSTGPIGSGTRSVAATATGAGVVALSTGGAFVVTATGSGAELVVYTDMGVATGTATIVGAGLVGKVGATSQSVSATATGAGAVAGNISGSLTATAAAAGAGRVGAVGSTAQTVTALASGAGAVGLYSTGSTLSVAMAATGTNFIPFNVTTSQSSQPVPQGAYGAWVTMVGSGGDGGDGYGSSSNGGRGGGGGGGGGALIGRSLVLAANMGSTYTFTIGTGSGVDSTFASGSVLITAGSGGPGTSGGAGTAGSAGSAGVASASGPGTGSVLLGNGGNGGAGGSISVGGDGDSTTNGAAAGGRGGGGANNNNTATPGNDGVATIGPGGNGGSGANGGGAHGASSKHTAGNAPGGTGPAGYGLVEWVGVPQNYNGGGTSPISDAATGAGQTGAIGAAAIIETATTATSGLLATSTGAAVLVTATATGIGQEGDNTGGQLLVTATATGAGSVNSTLGGLLLVTATGAGAGAVGKTATGVALSVTATTATGAVLGRTSGAAPVFTATDVGAGQRGEVTGGAYSVTATATGAGTVGKVTGAAVSITAVTTGFSVGNFVTRDSGTGYLMLSGQRFRFSGANTPFISNTSANSAYGATVDGQGNHLPNHAEIDATLTSMTALNVGVLRCYGAVMTAGQTNALQPTLGAFNSASLECVDYLLQQCKILGIKVIFPLTDNYNYAGIGGKYWYLAAEGITPDGDATQFFTDATTIAAFKAQIAYVLDHVNQYTGIAYKNDSTILAWETGNELTASGISAASYAAWTDGISQYIKLTKGAQQLVMDGKYGITADLVTFDTASLMLAYVDMYSNHTYDNSRTPLWLATEAAVAHSYGKAFYAGEYTWTDCNGAVGGTALNWTLTDMLSTIEGNPNIDGDAYWESAAPLTLWGGGFMLHRPGDDATQQARGSQIASHCQAMQQNGQQYVSILEEASTLTTSGSVSVTFRSAKWTPKTNDVVAVWVKVIGGTGIVVPSGWVNALGGTTVVSTSSDTYFMCYHIVTAAEALAGTLTYTMTSVMGTLGYSALGLVLRGVDVNNVVDSVASGFSNTASTTHVLPGVTSLLGGSVIIAGISKDGTGSYTQADGWGRAALNESSVTQWLLSLNTRGTNGGSVSSANITSDSSVAYAGITVAFSAAIGGNLTANASASGVGTLTSVLNVAATATGAGAVGKVGGAAVSVTATNTGAGLLAGSLFLIDNFTDTNGVNLTSHVPDTGGAWSVQPGNSGGFSIDTNHAYCTGVTQMINAATGVGADYEVIAQLIPLSAINNTSWGVMGRASNSADTCYFAFLYAFSGSFSIFLSKFVNGSYTQLGTAALPSQPTLGTTHEIKLRMVGSSISAYYDGVSTPIIAPVTDTDITAAGYAGIVGGTATTTTGVAIDKVTAGPINYPDTATDSITATATGTGALGFTDGGTSTITATAAGAGVVGKVGGAIVTITAAATGAGTAATAGSGGGAPIITATGTGTGSVKAASRQHVYRVMTRHRLR